jgi:NAD(P)H-dependent FMN reductase
MNMIKLTKNNTVFIRAVMLLALVSVQSITTEFKKVVPMKISIIVGSNRATTTGKQIAKNIEALLKKRSDLTTEVMYVGDYHLPFYTDSVSPASLAGYAVDPALQKWSEAIQQASAFIIIAPVYNAGYPAPLKNALDSLYKEWNNKPVGVIGYSGGPSGGEIMIKQLQQVFEELQMISVATSIKIPNSWKAFNDQGDLINLSAIEKDLNKMVDELAHAHKK